MKLEVKARQDEIHCYRGTGNSRPLSVGNSHRYHSYIHRNNYFSVGSK